MTDTNTTTPPTDETGTASSTSRIVLATVGVVGLIIAVGYFIMTQSGFDQKAVEQAVAQFEIHVEKWMKGAGEQNVDFTYDRIEMKGGATDRHAVLINPRFVTSYESSDDVQATETIRTDSVTLYPEGYSLSSVRVVFTDPVTVTNDELMTDKLSFAEPAEMTISQSQEQGKSFVAVGMELPTKAKHESFTEAGPAEVTEVSLDKGSNFTMKEDANDPNVGIGQVSLKNLRVTDVTEEESVEILSVASLNFSTDNTKLEDGNYHIASKGTVDELKADEEIMPYGVMSMDFDVIYKGPMDEMAEPTATAPVSELTINHLTLKALQGTLTLAGESKTGGAELLPTGKGQLQVDNLPAVREELVKREALDAESVKLLNLIFKQITDESWEEAVALDIEISREAGGSMKIGKATFEELMAIVLTGGNIVPESGVVETPSEGADTSEGHEGAVDAVPVVPEAPLSETPKEAPANVQ